MTKKKRNSSAAENLIESLMDDLKDLPAESSIQFPTEDSISPASTKAAVSEATNIWSKLEKDLEQELAANFGKLETPKISDSSAESEAESEADSEYESSYNSYESGEESVRKSELDDLEMALPEGFEDLDLPSAEDDEVSVYKGPSADGGYQDIHRIEDVPAEVPAYTQQKEQPKVEIESELVASDSDDSESSQHSEEKSTEDKTVSIQQDVNLTSSVVASNSSVSDMERTLAVDGFANARLGARKKPEVDVKVSVGHFRGGRPGNVMTSVDASLVQAENLKLAQQRILELENEVEQLRSENEELASAGEIIRSRTDQLAVRNNSLEKEKNEIQESAQSELLILKGNLQFKESEAAKARLKIEELEARLKSDFKKIRVRERELENRLELLKAEKSAVVRSKDEYILEQKRKIDRISQELDNYRKKCLELNKALEANQDQFKRTERALRLALTNLEAKEDSLTPLKKAE